MKAKTFVTKVALNIYDDKKCAALGTQVRSGRYLRKVRSGGKKNEAWLEAELCEDGYHGFVKQGAYLEDVLAEELFTPQRQRERPEIAEAIPEVLAFALEAMQTPNRYLWGGTIGPNFDCSGLVQTAFASQGIWLPRNAAEQGSRRKSNFWTVPITDDEITAGDLLFFSRSKIIDHVGIHLGNGFYIHSSGAEFGRDGIGIDQLSEKARGAGANYSPIYCYSRRVCSSLVPKIHL